MKKDLIAMVPPSLPRPDLLVSLTGIAELGGAIRLMISATRFWATWLLILGGSAIESLEYEGTSVVRKVWDGRAGLGELDVDGTAITR
jgi:hypothetical protein